MKKLFFLAILSLTFAGVNAQNYVKNGNFAEFTVDEATGLKLPVNWVLDGSAFLEDGTRILSLVTSWIPEGSAEGTRALDLWRGTDENYQLKLTQTISGLPDGAYTLSAIAALGGANSYSLYAKAGDNEAVTVPMAESGIFEKKEFANIQVTGGAATIGFTANSSSKSDWFDITNFEFVKTGELSSIKTILEAGISVKVARKSVAISSQNPVKAIDLISIDGKLLQSKKGNDVIFSNIQSGVYILRVNQISGTQTKKIVIE